MASYNINWLPSDLLTSPVEGQRRLKVEATLVDPIAVTASLFTTTLLYENGVIVGIQKLNKTSGDTLVKTLTYTNGNITSIDETIV